MSRLLMLLCLLLFLPLAATAAPPPVMLAGQWRDGADVSRYWVSEKLDGVRARWDGRTLWTRAGYRILAPAWFTQGWPRQPLDGELWSGRGQFESASATIRRHPPDDTGWRQLRFMAFDLPAHGGPFDQRLAALQAMVKRTSSATLAAVPQRRIADRNALQRHLQATVAAGGEGLMLHHQDNRYVAGRSDGLLKLKPWDDAEARVVAHLPGKGKYEGMLGALLVERDDGTRFRIGTGFKDAQRAAPPAIGSLVTYRHTGLTNHGLPRFARFLRVRDETPPPEADR